MQEAVPDSRRPNGWRRSTRVGSRPAVATREAGRRSESGRARGWCDGNPFPWRRVQELTPVVWGKGGCGGCLVFKCVHDTVIQSRQRVLELVYFNGC